MAHYLRLAYLLLLWSAHKVQSGARYTNLECKTLDKDFGNFPYCYIKAVNRTYQYVSLKARLLQKPITNISVTFAVKKKANGYKPFLYNYTIDACKFLKNFKGNPVIGFFYEAVASYTNLNHSCPYNHDIIVENASIYKANYLLNHLLPFPTGDYGFFMIWHVYNVPRFIINSFIQVF